MIDRLKGIARSKLTQMIEADKVERALQIDREKVYRHRVTYSGESNCLSDSSSRSGRHQFDDFISDVTPQP